jgi:hypothetical protein
VNAEEKVDTFIVYLLVIAPMEIAEITSGRGKRNL